MCNDSEVFVSFRGSSAVKQKHRRKTRLASIGGAKSSSPGVDSVKDTVLTSSLFSVQEKN